MIEICEEYERSFLPKIKSEFAKPPTKLRCGIARGQVISVGGGADYGSCINMAARLQKLGRFTFAFPRRGFPFKKCFPTFDTGMLFPIRVAIRGIGEDEIVIVRRSEYEAFTDEEKALFPPT